jgi:DNA-binding transcriptional ArsR family regulator
MSTYVNRMVPDPTEAGLMRRLERLTGTPGSTCLPRYGRLGRTVRSEPAFQKALARAKALADPHRLMAITLLRRQGELCACELQAALEVSHATVSHHMSVLVSAGLVRTRREGKWTYYRLGPGAREGALPV